MLHVLRVLPCAVEDRMLGLPTIQGVRAALNVVALHRINPRLRATKVSYNFLTPNMLHMRTDKDLAPTTPRTTVRVNIVVEQPHVIGRRAVIRLTKDQEPTHLNARHNIGNPTFGPADRQDVKLQLKVQHQLEVEVNAAVQVNSRVRYGLNLQT